MIKGLHYAQIGHPMGRKRVLHSVLSCFTLLEKLEAGFMMQFEKPNTSLESLIIVTQYFV